MTFKKGFMRRLNGLLLGLLCGVERLVSNSLLRVYSTIVPNTLDLARKWL